MGHTEFIISTKKSVDEITPCLTEALAAFGLSVYPSFDLRSACAPINSPCPHHGTIPCTCQLIVLMLYDWDQQQYGLLIHGSEEGSKVILEMGEAENNDLLINAVRSAVASADEIAT
jgi:hypothetical protein